MGDSRPIGCLTGDFTMKDEYWNKVTSERIRNPYSILLADKNIEPDGEVWNKIEDICHHTRSSAIPVVPDSIGTESNAFRLDALAVFMFRVLQRVNHPVCTYSIPPLPFVMFSGYLLLIMTILSFYFIFNALWI